MSEKHEFENALLGVKIGEGKYSIKYGCVVLMSAKT